MEELLNRAGLLIEQKRFKEAQDVIMQVLADHPDDPVALSLLFEIKLFEKKYQEAYELITRAVALYPDNDVLIYNLARAYYHLENYDFAEKRVQEAIALDPGEPAYLTFCGAIKFERKKFQEALDLANQSLALDAHNIDALNLRSMAQVKLNDKRGAFETVEGALREDPNNPFTHANYGWGLLEKGDPKAALKHFAEALRNDPNLDYAKSGMAEALKARYAIYRWYLQYAMWMNKLSSQYQWGVIIGIYFGFKVLRGIANSSPALKPFLAPLIFLLSLLVFSTWVIQPIGNLFLRLNPYGRHLLDEEEIKSSNFVAVCAAISVLGVLLYFLTWNNAWLVMAGVGFLMMLPCSVMFSPAKNAYVLMIITAVLALLGAGAVFTALSEAQLFSGYLAFFLLGIFIFQWIANFMLIRQSNR